MAIIAAIIMSKKGRVSKKTIEKLKAYFEKIDANTKQHNNQPKRNSDSSQAN